MGRRASNTAGLRKLLIAEMERHVDVWNRRLTRWPDVEPLRSEWLEDLKAGEAVVVSDGQIFSALYTAGLDWRPYAYGGQHWRKSFLLTERDELIELPDDE